MQNLLDVLKQIFIFGLVILSVLGGFYYYEADVLQKEKLSAPAEFFHSLGIVQFIKKRTTPKSVVPPKAAVSGQPLLEQKLEKADAYRLKARQEELIVSLGKLNSQFSQYWSEIAGALSRGKDHFNNNFEELGSIEHELVSLLDMSDINERKMQYEVIKSQLVVLMGQAAYTTFEDVSPLHEVLRNLDNILSLPDGRLPEDCTNNRQCIQRQIDPLDFAMQGRLETIQATVDSIKANQALFQDIEKEYNSFLNAGGQDRIVSLQRLKEMNYALDAQIETVLISGGGELGRIFQDYFNNKSVRLEQLRELESHEQRLQELKNKKTANSP